MSSESPSDDPARLAAHDATWSPHAARRSSAARRSGRRPPGRPRCAGRCPPPDRTRTPGRRARGPARAPRHRLAGRDHRALAASRSTGTGATGPGRLRHEGRPRPGPVRAGRAGRFRVPHPEGVLLVTADEEIGSPAVAPLVEARRRARGPALVCEASAPRRRAEGRAQGREHYWLHVSGRAAHAGLEPERGVNAAGRPPPTCVARPGRSSPTPTRGTTVTPTLARAGSDDRTRCPASGLVAVDVRATSAAEQTGWTTRCGR